MNVRNSLISGIFLLVAYGCALDSGVGINLSTCEYDFATSDHGWLQGFADYPAADSASFALGYDYTEKPGGGKALMLTGFNKNGDLFFFIKKRIDGLKPETDYTLTFDVEMLGTANGETVHLKVGATSMEPKAVIENGKYVMNIDKGAQDSSGENMLIIGNTDVPNEQLQYMLINRSNHVSAYDKPLIVKTNSKGALWLIVGADSGLRDVNTFYFTKVVVVLSSPD